MVNPYELADDIDDVIEVLAGNKILHPSIEKDIIKQSADMLRQQADRIAELEAEISTRTWVRKLLTEEKQGEPVGWYKKDSNDYFIENVGFPDFQVQEYIDAGYIPLYTTPQTKPLSFKEIDDRIDYAIHQGYGTSYCEGLEDGIKWAIEAKVREKK